MITAIEYVLMAGASYISTRADINKFPVPEGWTEITELRKNDPNSGFEATTFQRGTEIVITFAGTYPTDLLGDQTANAVLASGFGSDQLMQAAEYYLQVKALNPGAHITLTGHSLGGGLAALIGVFFNEAAVTFDQAPFRASANNDMRERLLNHLASLGYTDGPAITVLRNFTSSEAAEGVGASDEPGIRGEGNITMIRVDGEFLDTAPWTTFDRIGSTSSEILNSAAGVSGFELHSQALLTAFLQSLQTAVTGQALNDVTVKLPDLLQMLFDKNLFSFDTDKSDENLLERLVKHEAGAGTALPADQMVTRFTRDLWRLAQDGGLTLSDGNLGNPDLNEVSKTLIAFAMQFYYQDTPNAINTTKELFSTDGLTGGIRFDRNDVADTLAAVKGYNLYFKNYLFQQNLFNDTERQLIQSRLPALRDWFVQAGAGGMTATDTLNRSDFMLGGTGNDSLSGGDKSDLLVGNAGADTLKGGKGNDTLIGGTGFDRYIENAGDGFDTVLDRDGAGVIQLDGIAATGSAGLDLTKWKQLGEDTWVDTQNGIAYSKSLVNGETRLLVHKGDSNVLVKNWAADNLGIAMGAGAAPAQPVTTLTYTGDQRAPLKDDGSYDWNATAWVADGTLTGGVAQADFNDVIYGSAGADHMDGLGGNDALDGGEGTDRIDGGVGDDLIGGGAGADFIYGGEGNDTILSAATLSAPQRKKPGDNPTTIYSLSPGETIWTQGSTWLVSSTTIYGGSLYQDDAPDVIYAGDGIDLVVGGHGEDFIDGGIGSDSLWGNGGNDIIYGGEDDDEIMGDGTTTPGYIQTTPASLHGNDILIGGAGKDRIFGGGGHDLLLGGTEDDILNGDAGNDILDGGTGKDQLFGGAGNDTYLNVETGDMLAGAGDVIADLEDHSTIMLTNATGVSTNTSPTVASTADSTLSITLDNGATLNLQAALYGMDADIQFANGDTLDLESWVSENLGQSVKLNLANIQLSSGASITRAYGGLGNDQIQGAGNNDSLKGYGGSDLILGGAGNDVLDGGAGNDHLQGDAGSDTLYGGDGSDTLLGIDGNDTLDGGADNDELQGGVGDDVLAGGGGYDNLFGGSGGDSLDGGTGNDILLGNAGDDVYRFDIGGGMDTIWEEGDTAGDVLRFGAGIDAADIMVFKSGYDLLLAHTNGSDQMKIANWYTAVSYQLAHFEFSDGTVWDGIDVGNLGLSRLRGTTGGDVINGGVGADYLYGLDGNDTLYGNDGSDLLDGGAGGDRLDGGAGADTLMGGSDSDVYYVENPGDQVIERINEGNDTVNASITYALTEQVENLALSGGDAINGFGNELDNSLSGNDAANMLVGGAGNDVFSGRLGTDTLVGGSGDDVYYLDGYDDVLVEGENEGYDRILITQVSEQKGNTSYRGSFTLADNIESLWMTNYGYVTDATLYGNAIDNVIDARGTVVFDTQIGNIIWYYLADVDIYGGAGNDTLYSSDGGNVLDGGLGDDVMVGGSGGDTYYVDSESDQVVENTAYSTDSVYSTVTYALGANLDNLYLLSSANINGTGNDLNNVLNGNSGNNVLTGGAGDDRLTGGGGSDTLVGGIGNDTYLVSISGLIIEQANEGIDRVESSISYSLGAHLEELILTDSAAIDGTGNELDNLIQGNYANNRLVGGAGSDTLDGGSGSDTLLGGTGDDRYYVDSSKDVATEYAYEGIDTVFSSITYTLGNDLDNLTLTGNGTISGTGNALNNLLQGNAANNTLAGGAGNDWLDGMGGVDKLAGGTGDDTYVVDASGETVTERSGEGADVVLSSATFLLASNVEHLTLTGVEAINGTGNALNNVLTGNAAANLLNGGAGADRMVGGAGDDTYVVDNTLDVITENAHEGIDLIQTSIAITLAANVENLLLSGTKTLNGTGNALDNVLTGNSAVNTLTGAAGNDRLDGKGGADKLLGGTGNDTYVVDVVTDAVTENVNEGSDTVETGISYTLGANVENLALTGAAAINGTGNAMDNRLVGNSAANGLVGAAGNDLLDGGVGADTLTGGVGNDTYILGRGHGADTVVESDASAGNTDIAQFLTGVSVDQIWFQHVGNNLEASIVGTADKLVVKDWYSGMANHVELFKTTDGGKTLIDSNVENLVNAMASFAPPAAGQTTLPPNYQDALAGAIAANWQ